MNLANAQARLLTLLETIDPREIPVAALIFDENGIISEATNAKEGMYDVSGHAEIIAIRKAGLVKKNWYLNNTTLITTLEPCPMCIYAIIEARIKRVIYFAKDIKNGAINSLNEVCSRINTKKLPTLIYEPQVVFEKILKDFFKKLRQ